MLIELFGENFGCFRDEFRLSMLATDIDRDSARGVIKVPIEGDPEPLRLLRAAAIYGPNASGKSTVLLAAKVLGNLIDASAQFRSDQPLPGYIPFSLDRHMRQAPVMLGVKGIVNGKVYEYRVRFDKMKVVEESLSQLTVDKPANLFDRQGQDVDGPWKEHDEFHLLTKAFRANALVLSLADSLAPSLAENIAVGLSHLLVHAEPTEHRMWRFRNHPVAQIAESDRQFAEWLRCRIRDVDIGVIDYETEEVRDPFRSTDEGEDESQAKGYRLRLLHEGVDGPTPLPFGRESLGTRRYLELTPYFYYLSHGDRPLAYFLDELDASLHPVLLERLVHHFNGELPASKVTGQLIFATHATDLVDDEARKATLRRDQVYFTEKDAVGAARLYSLAEFRERNNLNIRRRYLQGRYGAIPSLGDFAEK